MDLVPTTATSATSSTTAAATIAPAAIAASSAAASEKATTASSAFATSATFFGDGNDAKYDKYEDEQNEDSSAISGGCEVHTAACEGDGETCADGEVRHMAFLQDEVGRCVDAAEILFPEADFRRWPDFRRWFCAEGFVVGFEGELIPIAEFRALCRSAFTRAVVQAEAEGVFAKILPIAACVAEMEMPCLIDGV